MQTLCRNGHGICLPALITKNTVASHNYLKKRTPSALDPYVLTRGTLLNISDIRIVIATHKLPCSDIRIVIATAKLPYSDIRIVAMTL